MDLHISISLSTQILLDQSFLMGVNVLWESQLEYHVCRNDWEEVSKLLDLVPTSILSDGNLQVSLDSLQPASTVGYNREPADYGNYLCSLEELDAVCMDIPDVKIFRFSANIMCSIWLKLLMEEKLARKFIFMKEYWEGTAEIVSLLARSGFITIGYKHPFEDDHIKSSSDLKFSDGGSSHVDTVKALHKLFVRHCGQNNLPNLLDLYLDHHKLVLDNESLSSLQEAAVSFYKSSECTVLHVGSSLIVLSLITLFKKKPM
jgi:spatacsin